jgi:hypothetical protein
MPVFHEGKLIFTFPDSGKTSQYDQWTHYRQQFNKAFGGAKAVDFIHVETGDKTAWLIEVKDYRVHPRTKLIDLPNEIAEKIRDTLAGLVSAQCQANDAGEKNMARDFLRCRKLRVVLHLEQPKKPSRLRPQAIDPSQVQQKLKGLVKAIDAHPLVIDRRYGGTKWKVEEVTEAEDKPERQLSE